MTVEGVCRQRYVAVYEQADDGGWSCRVPSFPEVFAWERTDSRRSDASRMQSPVRQVA